MRPYRATQWSVPEALAELRRCAGTQFDPRIVAAFGQMIRERPYLLVRSEMERSDNLSEVGMAAGR